MTYLQPFNTLTLPPHGGIQVPFIVGRKGQGNERLPNQPCSVDHFRRSEYTDSYKDAGVMHSVRSREAAVHWCQGSTSLEGSQV